MLILAFLLMVNYGQQHVIVGRPVGKPSFSMLMDEADPVASVYECEDRIHALKVAGVCEVPKDSAQPRKTPKYEKRYPDIKVVEK